MKASQEFTDGLDVSSTFVFRRASNAVLIIRNGRAQRTEFGSAWNVLANIAVWASISGKPVSSRSG